MMILFISSGAFFLGVMFGYMLCDWEYQQAVRRLRIRRAAASQGKKETPA